MFLFSIKYQFLCILSDNLKHVERQILHPFCHIGVCFTSTIYIQQGVFACAQEVMTCIDNCTNVHGTIIRDILGRKRRAASCYDLCVQMSKVCVNECSYHEKMIVRVFLDRLVTLHKEKYYNKHKYCYLRRL